MVHWIGAQVLVKLVKNSKICPLCDVTKRNPQPNQMIFLLIEARTLVEAVDGLNSSLAIAVGELWPKTCGPLY